ncbi:MAG TPA: GNAT family N-acetyltransferase [Actinomycetota bacterium]|nr:GNAT family N-acetyltransferase [Actinomycetota bacterium]
MSDLPEGYSIRPATSDDVDPVADALAAEDLAATGAVFYDADFVRAVWSVLDLPNDTWVIEAPGGRVIGHANVGREGGDVAEAWGIVHPGHRGLGIGSRLLDLVDERAAALLPRGGRLQQAVGDTDLVAAGMLQTRGFDRVRSFRHMEIELEAGPPSPDPPAGIEIREIDPERDLPTVHSVVDEGFRGEWGYQESPFEEWRARNVEDRDFDPGLWLLASEDGEPVGALTGVMSGDRGWVLELAVRSRWRGRGVGSAMLRRSFASFAERGLPRVMLNVDSENPTGAVGVYERAGMRAVRSWDVYERTLPAS